MREGIKVSVTKRRVLEEMLEMYSALQRSLSMGMRNEIPEDGCDGTFYALEAKREVVREMIRDLNKTEKEAE